MKDFKCKKCGKCCSNLLPLSKEDIKAIKNHKNLRDNRWYVDKNWYMICPFLNYKHECDVYDDRPTICREYTCQAFKSMQFSEKLLESFNRTTYELVDMREKFFGGKR